MPFLPKAAQYMLLSALGFSLMSLFVKLSADLGIPVMEILLFCEIPNIFEIFSNLQ